MPCLYSDGVVVEPLNTLVVRARTGDLEAFGRIVGATEAMWRSQG
jgi:hypothetical protein